MKARFQKTQPLASDRTGFTLIEILTAITVLTLMLLMVNQLINSAAAVMSMSGRRLDADAQARLIFNRMAVDFERMLKRTDVDYSSFKQPMNNLSVPPQVANLQDGSDAGNPSHNDQLAFYSETHGYFSGATAPDGITTFKGDMSLVAYMVANDPVSKTPVLQRMGKGLGWEPNNATASAWNNVAYLPVTLTTRWTDLFQTVTSVPADPDYRSIGDIVFRMEYTYLLKATSTQAATLSITPYVTGHNSINGFKDVAALVVTIAMLDNSSRHLVNNYTNLVSSLPDAVNQTTDTINKGDIAAAWNAVVNSPTFATTANIPKTAASSVRVYERYFYLNSPQ
jgi:prepilin-type N-terminal cleavage/methylation domain-containing protein